MTKRRGRKCLNCRRLFRPDPRNVRHQRYCSEPACRQASKAASQRAGCLNHRTGTTSAAPSMWSGCGPGGRRTRAMSAAGAVRYKMTHRRKSLIGLKKQAP